MKSLTERVLGKFGYKKGVGPLIDDSRIYRSFRSYLDSIDSMEVTDPYEKSVWVFASINAISQNISRVPFYIYTEKTKDVKKIISDGPTAELFTNPNPYMISSTLFFATVLHMELFGEAFWVFEGRNNVTELPKEIWIVNPQRLEPVIEKQQGGNGKFNGYWKYKVGDYETVFAPHEILQLKYYNPYNEIRGLSPIEAARVGVEQDYFANKYNKQFFKDGVALSGIISVPEFLSDEQFNRLKNQFEERHAGYGKAHKVGVIEGGANFTETKRMSQKDMEFSVLKDVIRGEILAAFKTNEVVLGNYSNIQSYEGIRNAHESFWKETLLPKIIYIEDFLWAKFFSKISGGKYWGGFDTSVIEALREDFGKKVDMAKVLNEMGYPINFINKRLDMGFEEVPWGNTWWVKMGTIPVESAMEFITNPTTPGPSDEEPVEEPGDKPEPEDEEPETEPKPSKDLDLNLSLREDSLWANFIARQVPIENMFKSKLKKYLYDQRVRVLTNLSSKKQVFNFTEEKELLKQVLTNLYAISNQTGTELLKDELILDEIIDTKEINEFVANRLEFASNTIATTMGNSVLKVLEKVRYEEKGNKIRELYNKTDNKVFQISRTESAAIINGVRFLLMQKHGIKYHKWLSKSENGRHSAFHGKVVKLGESFSNDFTIRYPLDNKAPVTEIINCRCYTVPVIQIK